MKIYYSDTTKGFYKSDINKELPDDAVEITEDEYKELYSAANDGRHTIELVGKKPTKIENITADDFEKLESISALTKDLRALNNSCLPILIKHAAGENVEKELSEKVKQINALEKKLEKLK